MRFAALLMPLFCLPSFAFEIVAHRGASKDAPENTVAATRLAFEQGAHGVECDIYRTADGRIAVLHDASTKRTTGVDGKVEKMTLGELQKLDAGSWMDTKFAGEKIPSMEEIFATVPDSNYLLVELKGGEELVEPLKEALQRTPRNPEQVAFISFNYKALHTVKKEFPKHKALWLASYKVDKETGKEQLTLDEAIRKCKDAGFEGLSLSKTWPIDAAFVKKIHDAGLVLSVWTVNDAKEAEKLIAAGADILCTDKPGYMKEALKK